MEQSNTGRKYLIFLLAKCAGDDIPGCPTVDAHLGPKDYQDWYRAVKFGVSTLRLNPGSKLLIVTGLKFPWWANHSELENYVKEAKALGLGDDEIISIEEGGETISQLEAAECYARETGQLNKLVIVCTWTHRLRLHWLCRGKGYHLYGVFGTPIIKPLIADFIFTFAFPIVDFFDFLGFSGPRERILRFIRKRRDEGVI